MMLSAKLGAESTLRAMICTDFMTNTKTIVLASATVAAPLKLSMFISKNPLVSRIHQVIRGTHQSL